MGKGWRRLERGSNRVSVINVDLTYARLLTGVVDFATLQVTVFYVLGNLTGNVHTDHPALTQVGKVTLPGAGLTKAAIQTAIQAVEPSINFVGGDTLIG